MKPFRRGGIYVRYCGLSRDLEGRANIGFSLVVGHLQDMFGSMTTNYLSER
jgi:hypothetical protein